MRPSHGEEFFTPARHVTFPESFLCLAYTHAIANSQFRLAPTSVASVYPLPHSLLVRSIDTRRSHSDGAMIRMNPGNASTYSNVWCFVKYRHIRVFSVRLKRSTILAFVSSLCVTKWWIPCVSTSFWKGRLRNSVPLSVCNAVGVVFSVSKRSNAATSVAPTLFFNGTRHARFEKKRRLPSTGTLYHRCIFSGSLRQQDRPATAGFDRLLRRVVV